MSDLIPDLTDDELDDLDDDAFAYNGVQGAMIKRAVAELRRRRAAMKARNRQSKRLDRIAKAMELLQGKLDAFRLTALGQAEDDDESEAA